ncbi:hypothetical protein IE987_21315 [Klebsiella pneumoniae]|uniref:Uncharacterized protein n=1 Tax=Klebsiella pneumoniae TaxID=573 RepID=A0A927DPS6_KLEPN|nr:hypothetical protein [Klebsiella pneumoniae]
MGDINHLIAFLLQPGIDGALDHHPHCRQQDNNHQNEEAADVAGDQGEFFGVILWLNDSSLFVNRM